MAEWGPGWYRSRPWARLATARPTGAGPLRSARTRAQVRAGRTDWYRIKNLSEPGAAEVMIYDEIGWFGVTAGDFVRELSALNVNRIDLRLNSPGGDAFDGIAIYNALRNHPAQVHVFVDALAASAASVIAMAGDKVTMRRSSQMMIHEAFGLVVGDAADMRAQADVLDALSDDIATTYRARAGGKAEDWRALMHAETWFSASEAVRFGLADEAESDTDPDREPGTAENSFDLSIYNYRGRDAAPAPRSLGLSQRPETPPLAEPPSAPGPAPDDDFLWDDSFAEALRLSIQNRAKSMPAPAQPPKAAKPADDDDDNWGAIDAASFLNALREGLTT